MTRCGDGEASVVDRAGALCSDISMAIPIPMTDCEGMLRRLARLGQSGCLPTTLASHEDGYWDLSGVGEKKCCWSEPWEARDRRRDVASYFASHEDTGSGGFGSYFCFA